jgi:hypothetical protein
MLKYLGVGWYSKLWGQMLIAVGIKYQTIRGPFDAGDLRWEIHLLRLIVPAWWQTTCYLGQLVLTSMIAVQSRHITSTSIVLLCPGFKFCDFRRPFPWIIKETFPQKHAKHGSQLPNLVCATLSGFPP